MMAASRNEMIAMLAQCYPLVQAQAGAEHMLDGFNRGPNNSWDDLAIRIANALQGEYSVEKLEPKHD